MARLYSNENFPIQVVQVLRKLGHDIITIQEQGKANEAVADPDVLQLAIAEQRAILTLNRRDFIRLHKSQPHHQESLSVQLILTSTGKLVVFMLPYSQCHRLKEC